MAFPPTGQVDLKEPIAGGIKSLGEKEIGLVPGVDVGHAPVIDQNLNRLSQVGQVYGFRRNCLSFFGVSGYRTQRYGGQQKTQRE